MLRPALSVTLFVQRKRSTYGGRVPDLALGVTVSRGLLGKGRLHINDRVRYKVGDQFLGAGVQWQRNQVTSPYVDGAVTVSRTRQIVNDQVNVEVYGRNYVPRANPNDRSFRSDILQRNESELIEAFSQDFFTLAVVADGVLYAYNCEAADYQISWTGPRRMAKQSLITFTVPHHPVPLISAPDTPTTAAEADPTATPNPDDTPELSDEDLDAAVAAAAAQLGFG